MNTLASSLIQRAEAADGWDELPAAEQLALRAILRRVGLMAIRGSTTAEDWSQLAGFAEWPVGKGPAAAALPLTVHGEWIDRATAAALPAGHQLVQVRYASGAVGAPILARALHWQTLDLPTDIAAFRYVD